MPAVKVSPSMPSTTAFNQQSIKSLKSSNNFRSIRPSLTNTESNDSSDNFASDITESDNSVKNYYNSSTYEVKLKPYQRVLHSLESDERWQKEITLGRRVGFYRFRGEIGTGNFSQVKVALHCLTREKVAVKILDKSKLDSKTRKMLLREINSMEVLHHPNIITIFEVIETLSKIHIVMEFAPNGELFQFITREGRLQESDAKHLFTQIVSAIDHMHNNHIIHRDIKAENIFFSDYKTVKVGDFGFSTRVHNEEELLSTFCGSPPYAAPELFNDESYLGPYVDYWALGVLLYFMATALMPFKAQTIAALKKLILEGVYDIPDHLSQELVFVIKGLLQIEYKKRLNLTKLKQTDWLKNQTFPESLPQFKLQLFDCESEEHNNNICMSFEEREAYKQMKDLGINNVLIAENLDKGSKSTITGSFAIIIHRILKSKFNKKSDLKTKDIITKNSNEFNYNQSIDSKHTKSSKSLTKSIKSLKNIFIDKTISNTTKVGESSLNNNQNYLSKTTKNCRRIKRSKTCCLL